MVHTRRSMCVVMVVIFMILMGIASTGFCQQQIPPRVKAVLSAKPSSYTGNCPALITFGGYIAVNQPMTVQYKFIRSDNAESPVQTLYFSSKSSQEVTTTWQLGGPGLPTYSGWEAIQVISPVSVESNKAEFKIRCTDQGQPGQQGGPGPQPGQQGQQGIPPRVEATLDVKPASYRGDCPALINFRGHITVNQPMTVQYKFIRSDNASAPIQTLYFPSKGTQEVTTTWQLGGPELPTYGGWEAIQVISPVSVESNKAEFRIRCKGQGQPGQQGAPVRIKARLGVKPASYTGSCPALINFRGHITVNQPTTVQYKFIRSDNAEGPVQTLNFPKAGTQEVTTTWQLGGPGLPTYSGWEAIQVISPVSVESNKAEFRIRCVGRGQSGQQGGSGQQPGQQGQQGIPIDVKARLSAKPASYTGNCPALITFGGYIAVNQPMTVQYKFIRSDNAESPVQTLYFSSKSSQEVTTTWQLGGPRLPTYSGWEAIQVISPVSVESNKAEFSIRCAGQPGVVTRPGRVGRPGVEDRPEVVAQPSAGKEDCIAFNPSTTTAQLIQGSWKIVDGSHWMFDFGNNEREANKALAIIQTYRMNQSCFVGRPNPSFQYMLASGNAPAGALQGEDCVAFNPATTAVQQIQGSWKIVDGSHWMFDFGTNKAEADQALAIIKKYGFNHSCFVGRPGPSFKYLRR